MSRIWKHTDLVYGEDLVLPDEFFEVPAVARQRMLYCRYFGETENGIIVEIQYKSGIGSEDPLSGWRVQKFISFGQIYCGEVRIYRRDRTTVYVERAEKIDTRVARKEYTWREVNGVQSRE